jgi:pimeloyl-ACP methyl ester carboxylesterase
MPNVETGDGVTLHWEEVGEGPGLLLAHSYIQHPGVFGGLTDDLARDHRVVTYDARGTGRSSRSGPYDMETDVADLTAVVEDAGPFEAVIANGEAANRAVYLAADRPELLPTVISLESLPVGTALAEGSDALVASTSVLDALMSMMRTDYRAGLSAALQRANPEMTPDDLRERVALTADYCGQEAGTGRLETWIRDDAADAARSLGDRLVVLAEGSGEWFPSDLHDAARRALPEARIVRLEGGAISRPDLSAMRIREITGVRDPSTG